MEKQFAEEIICNYNIKLSTKIIKMKDEGEIIVDLSGWTDEDPRVILATVLGIFVAVVLMVISHRREVKRKEQKQTAIQLGNVITAKRVKVWKSWKTTDSGREETYYNGTYEYTVNGKTKRYSIGNKMSVPLTDLYLYYVDSPKKVFSDYDTRWGFSIAVLLGIATCILTLLLTGYISFG